MTAHFPLKLLMQGVLDYRDLNYHEFAIPGLVKDSIYSSNSSIIGISIIRIVVPKLLGFQLSGKFLDLVIPIIKDLLYKQFLWKMFLHIGVSHVTETAYMWYLESTDSNYILIRSFCGNWSTNIDEQFPLILLIKVQCGCQIRYFFSVTRTTGSFCVTCFFHTGGAVSTETGYKLDFIIKALFQISQILKLWDYNR